MTSKKKSIVRKTILRLIRILMKRMQTRGKKLGIANFPQFSFVVRPSAFNNEKIIRSYGFFKSSDSFRSHLRNNDV